MQAATEGLIDVVVTELGAEVLILQVEHAFCRNQGRGLKKEKHEADQFGDLDEQPQSSRPLTIHGVQRRGWQGSSNRGVNICP